MTYINRTRGILKLRTAIGEAHMGIEFTILIVVGDGKVIVNITTPSGQSFNVVL